MEIDLHQLELRYQSLRKRNAKREARLLASLGEIGQQAPVVVVAAGGGAPGRYVLLDGYKRVRALTRLRHDTVVATCWDLGEADALLLERLMRTPEGDGPLEQGWLLAELRDRFAMSLFELACRFDKSASWVSRRLALVADLPAPIQEQVQRGELAAHAAMKHLVPLARANPEEAVRLCAALGPLRPSCRQVATVCAAWLAGTGETRDRLLADLALFLRAEEELRRRAPPERSPADQLLGDFGALGGIARRAHKRLRDALGERLTAAERDEVHRCQLQCRAELRALFARWDKEQTSHAGRDHADRHPSPA